MGTNWKLNSVFNGDVELPKEDTYHNIAETMRFRKTGC